jgi:N12 class adenine-specific DNA methylase
MRELQSFETPDGPQLVGVDDVAAFLAAHPTAKPLQTFDVKGAPVSVRPEDAADFVQAEPDATRLFHFETPEGKVEAVAAADVPAYQAEQNAPYAAPDFETLQQRQAKDQRNLEQRYEDATAPHRLQDYAQMRKQSPERPPQELDTAIKQAWAVPQLGAELLPNPVGRAVGYVARGGEIGQDEQDQTKRQQAHLQQRWDKTAAARAADYQTLHERYPDRAPQELTDVVNRHYGLAGSDFTGMDSGAVRPAERGVAGEVTTGLEKFFAVDAPDAFAAIVRFVTPRDSAAYQWARGINETAETIGKTDPNQAPSLDPELHPGASAFRQGAEMLPISVIPNIAAGRLMLGFGVPVRIARFLGPALGLIPDVVQQGYQSRDSIEQGLLAKGETPETASRLAALGGVFSGLIEGLGETVDDFFGPQSAVFKAMGLGWISKKSMRSALLELGAKKLPKQAAEAFIKEFLFKTMPVETLTEMSQQAGEAASDQAMGAEPQGTPWEQAKSVIGPTLAMNVLMLPGIGMGVGHAVHEHNNVHQLLTDGAANPVERLAAGNLVMEQIKELDPAAAVRFRDALAIALVQERPLPLNNMERFWNVAPSTLTATPPAQTLDAAGNVVLTAAPPALQAADLNAFNAQIARELTPLGLQEDDRQALIQTYADPEAGPAQAAALFATIKKQLDEEDNLSGLPAVPDGRLPQRVPLSAGPAQPSAVVTPATASGGPTAISTPVAVAPRAVPAEILQAPTPAVAQSAAIAGPGSDADEEMKRRALALAGTPAPAPVVAPAAPSPFDVLSAPVAAPPQRLPARVGSEIPETIGLTQAREAIAKYSGQLPADTKKLQKAFNDLDRALGDTTPWPAEVDTAANALHGRMQQELNDRAAAKNTATVLKTNAQAATESGANLPEVDKTVADLMQRQLLRPDLSDVVQLATGLVDRVNKGDFGLQAHIATDGNGEVINYASELNINGGYQWWDAGKVAEGKPFRTTYKRALESAKAYAEYFKTGTLPARGFTNTDLDAIHWLVNLAAEETQRYAPDALKTGGENAVIEGQQPADTGVQSGSAPAAAAVSQDLPLAGPQGSGSTGAVEGPQAGAGVAAAPAPAQPQPTVKKSRLPKKKAAAAMATTVAPEAREATPAELASQPYNHDNFGSIEAKEKWVQANFPELSKQHAMLLDRMVTIGMTRADAVSSLKKVLDHFNSEGFQPATDPAADYNFTFDVDGVRVGLEAASMDSFHQVDKSKPWPISDTGYRSLAGDRGGFFHPETTPLETMEEMQGRARVLIAEGLKAAKKKTRLPAKANTAPPAAAPQDLFSQPAAPATAPAPADEKPSADVVPDKHMLSASTRAALPDNAARPYLLDPAKELVFPWSMKVADLNGLWDDFYAASVAVDELHAPEIKRLREQLAGLKGGKGDVQAERKRLTAQVETLEAQGRVIVAESEARFADAQEELSERFKERAKQAGITDESDLVDAAEGFMGDISSRPGIEQTWDMTLDQVATAFLKQKTAAEAPDADAAPAPLPAPKPPKAPAAPEVKQLPTREVKAADAGTMSADDFEAMVNEETDKLKQGGQLSLIQGKPTESPAAATAPVDTTAASEERYQEFTAKVSAASAHPAEWYDRLAPQGRNGGPLEDILRQEMQTAGADVFGDNTDRYMQAYKSFVDRGGIDELVKQTAARIRAELAAKPAPHLPPRVEPAATQPQPAAVAPVAKPKTDLFGNQEPPGGFDVYDKTGPAIRRDMGQPDFNDMEKGVGNIIGTPASFTVKRVQKIEAGMPWVWHIQIQGTVGGNYVGATGINTDGNAAFDEAWENFASRARKHTELDKAKDKLPPSIYKVGQRVVIQGNEQRFGQGRHGVITADDSSIYTTRTIFGGDGKVSMSKSEYYAVKTDAGAEFSISVRELVPEADTARPAVVPDPELVGKPMPPEDLLHRIHVSRDYEKRSRASAERRRKPESRAADLRSAEKYKTEGDGEQAVFDAWARQYPDAAALYNPKPAVQKPQAEIPAAAGVASVSGVKYAESEQHDGVELRFPGKPDGATISALKAHGFRWSPRARLWYAKRNPSRIAWAKAVAGSTVAATPPNSPQNNIVAGKQPVAKVGTLTSTDTHGAVFLGPEDKAYFKQGGTWYLDATEGKVVPLQNPAATVKLDERLREAIEQRSSAAPVSVRGRLPERVKTDQSHPTDTTHTTPPTPATKTLGQIGADVAKLGVKGADEALKGLFDLFGGGTHVGALGPTFDEDTWAKAKPHFQTSYQAFVDAGRGLREFVAAMLKQFGASIKPYLMRFHQELSAPAAAPAAEPVVGHDAYGKVVHVNDVVRYNPPSRPDESPREATLRARIDQIGPDGYLELRVWDPELGTITEMGRQTTGFLTSQIAVDEAAPAKKGQLPPKATPESAKPTAQLTPEAAAELLGLGENDLRPTITNGGKTIQLSRMPASRFGSIAMNAAAAGWEVAGRSEYPDGTVQGSFRQETTAAAAATPAKLAVPTDRGKKDVESGQLDLFADRPQGVILPLDTGDEDARQPDLVLRGHGAESGDAQDTGGETQPPGRGDSGRLGGEQSQGTQAAGGDGRVGGKGAGSPKQGAGNLGVGADPRLRPSSGPRGVRDGRRPESQALSNYVITPADMVGEGGLKAKYAGNVAAIKLLKELEAERRTPTSDEQRILVRYVGWGGLKGVFTEGHKQWSREGAELKTLLTPEEYDAAKRSILDAHYTSPTVIQKGIYAGLQRFGFTGGKMVEGGVGLGHFIGLLPEAWRGVTSYLGVEQDSLTARLAQMLYPQASIHHMGFQDADLAPGTFDGAAGNPPFGQQQLYDKHFKHLQKFSIHNYFLAKQLELLRPGGVAGFVVSHYFMDAQDSAAREHIAGMAKFLGAIRLPNTAFKGNANTEVVTDLVFFQRLPEGQRDPDAASWTKVVDYREPVSGVTFKLNAWTKAHPEMVLGEFALAENGLHSDHDLTVNEPDGQDLGAELTRAVGQLPAKIYRATDTAVQERLSTPETVDVPDVPVGSFFLGPEGELLRRTADENMERRSAPYADAQKGFADRVRLLVPLRDALNALVKMELAQDSDPSELTLARHNLNRAYDKFVKQFGFLNQPFNRRAFYDDPQSARILGLEQNYDPGLSATVAEKNGDTARPPKAEKAAIFSKRVNTPYREVTHVENSADALAVSLNQRGVVDLDYMAELSGKERKALLDELHGQIFRNARGSLETAAQFLSGDVRTKLSDAEAAVAQGDASFADEVAALKAVIPKDIDPTDIVVPVGAGWVPATDVAQFASELTGTAPQVCVYIKASGGWGFDHQDHGVASTQTWGTKEARFGKLFGDLLNSRITLIMDEVEDAFGNKRQVVNREATEMAQAKANELRSKWADWVFQEPSRRQRLHRVYNDTINRYVDPHYDGSHLTMPGKSALITLNPHQSNAVWRVITDMTTMLDHCVGAGKTFVGVGAFMELRRMGRVRKPLFAVPNHLVTQWRDQFIRLYPNANVPYAQPADFQKGRRERLFAKILTGDYDAIILGHSSIKKIGVSVEEETRLLTEMRDELIDAIKEMKDAERGAGRTRSSRQTAQLERTKEALEAKLARLADGTGKRDAVATFEEMGIDGLFVDEAHEFKNLFYTTQMRSVAGLGDPNGSAKAFDLYLKTRYLQHRYGGKAPLVFATGTPISNSLVEMFTVQRYLQPDTLRQMGLTTLDAWARVFADVRGVYEVDPTGTGYRMKTRLANFQNVGELAALYRTMADVITLADLHAQAALEGKRFPVPKVKGGKPEIHAVERTPEQAAYFGVEQQVMAPDGTPAFDSNGDPIFAYPEGTILWRVDNMPDDPKQDNMLKLTSDARKAALDMRLIDPSAPDRPESKTNQAIKSIMRLYHAWTADRGAQIVFCDLSVPAGARDKIAAPLVYRNADGSLEEGAGRPVTIEGAPEWAACVVLHRQGSSAADSGYVVMEISTGQVLGADHKRAGALADAHAKMDAPAWKLLKLFYDKRGPLTSDEVDTWRDAQRDKSEDVAAPVDGEGSISVDELLALESKFSVYDDLKAKLIKQGIPANEVAFIHDYETPDQKAKLFDAVNAGRVRVLIGNTARMGTGMNVQDRLVGMHHLDAPWKPSDLEQREGRIIRQKNKLYDRDPEGFEVEIHRYATKQTYDTRMWQLIEHKARGIEGFRKADRTTRRIEDVSGEAANSSEMKAAASGDPRIQKEMQLRNELQSAEIFKRSWDRNHYDLENRDRWLQGSDERHAGRVATARAMIEQRDAHTTPKEFSFVTPDGETLTKPAGLAVRLAVAVKRGGRQPFGIYRGFTFDVNQVGNAGFTIDARPMNQTGALSMEVTSYGAGDQIDNTGLQRRLDNWLASFDNVVVIADDDLRRAQEEIKAVKAELAKTFPKADELARLQREHTAVVQELMAAKRKKPAAPAPAAPPAPDSAAPSSGVVRDAAAAWQKPDMASINTFLAVHGVLDPSAAGAFSAELADVAAVQPDPIHYTPAGQLTVREQYLHLPYSARVSEEQKALRVEFSKAEKAVAQQRVLTGKAFPADVVLAFGAGDTVSSILRQYVEPTGKFVASLRGLKIETGRDVAAAVRILRSPYVETLKALYLNSQSRVLEARVVTLGSLDVSVVHQREIFAAMPPGTASIILAHNHPSGDPSPSAEDIHSTRKLVEAGKLAGVPITDHVITNGTKFTSLRAAGLVEFGLGQPKPVTVPGKRQRLPSKASLAQHTAAPEQAAWEVLSRDQLVKVNTPDLVQRIAYSLRQASPDSGHLLYLNVKYGVQAITRFPLSELPNLSMRVAREAGWHGTAAFIVDLPIRHDDPALVAAARRLVAAGKVLEITCLDVIGQKADPGGPNPTKDYSTRDAGVVSFTNESKPAQGYGDALTLHEPRPGEEVRTPQERLIEKQREQIDALKKSKGDAFVEGFKAKLQAQKVGKANFDATMEDMHGAMQAAGESAAAGSQQERLRKAVSAVSQAARSGRLAERRAAAEALAKLTGKAMPLDGARLPNVAQTMKQAIAEGKKTGGKSAAKQLLDMLGEDAGEATAEPSTLGPMLRKAIKVAHERGKAIGEASVQAFDAAVDMALQQQFRERRMHSKDAQAAWLSSTIGDILEARRALHESLATPATEDAPAGDPRDAARKLVESLFGKEATQLMRRVSRSDWPKFLDNLVRTLEAPLKVIRADDILRTLLQKEARPANLTPTGRAAYEDLVRNKLFPAEAIEEINRQWDKRKAYKEFAAPDRIQKFDKDIGKFKQKLADYFAERSLDDVQHIFDQLTELVQQSKAEKYVVIEGRKVLKSNLAGALAAEMRAGSQAFPETMRTRPWFHGKMADMHKGVRELALFLAGGTQNSVAEKLLYTMQADAESDALALDHRLHEGYRAQLKAHGVGFSERLRWKSRKLDLLFQVAGPKDEEGHPTSVERKLQLTPMQAMFLRNTARASDALEKLNRSPIEAWGDQSKSGAAAVKFRGGKDALAQIQRETERLLTPAQKAVGDWLMSQLNTAEWKAMLNRTSLALEGVERFYDPSYWPDYVDRSASPMQDDIKTLEAALNDEQGGGLSWGRVNARVRHHQPLLLKDAEDTFFQQVKDSARYAHQFIPALTAVGALRHKNDAHNIAGMVAERVGTHALRFIRETIYQAAGRPEMDVRGFDKVLGKIASNAAIGVLWGRLTSVLNNRIGGSVLMISELRNTYGAEAALRYLARIELPGPAFWAKVENRKASKLLMQNGYMGHRWGEEYLEAAGNVRAGELGHQLDLHGARWRRFQEIGLLPMQWAEMKNGVTAFRVLKEMGYTDAEAVKAVERMTRDTQNTSSALDESQLYRSLKGNRALWLVFPFMSQPAVGGRLLQRDAISYAGAKGAAAKAAAAASLASTTFGLAASATLSAVIYSLFRAAQRGDPWPPQDAVEKARQLANLTGNVADSLWPGLGRLTDMGLALVEDGVYRDPSMFGRIVDRIATGFKNMAKADHLSVDDPKAVKGIEALVDGLGMALGLPYSGPMQSVKAVAGLAGAPLTPAKTSAPAGGSFPGRLPPAYRLPSNNFGRNPLPTPTRMPPRTYRP